MAEQDPQSAFVLASDRSWNGTLAARLEKRTGYRFVPIARRQELSLSRLGKMQPRAIFFPHWSSRIPREIHESFECIMFHMTDLPYGRGGTPLQNLIVRGHRNTVMTAFRCTEEMDAGPIYLKFPFSLHGPARDIFRRADELVEEMIVKIINDQPTPIEQSGEVVKFHRRKPEDGNLAPLRTVEEIYDHIRMLDADGYPNAFIETEKFRFEFSHAEEKAGGLTAEVSITPREVDSFQE